MQATKALSYFNHEKQKLWQQQKKQQLKRNRLLRKQLQRNRRRKKLRLRKNRQRKKLLLRNRQQRKLLRKRKQLRKRQPLKRKLRLRKKQLRRNQPQSGRDSLRDITNRKGPVEIPGLLVFEILECVYFISNFSASSSTVTRTLPPFASSPKSISFASGCLIFSCINLAIGRAP